MKKNVTNRQMFFIIFLTLTTYTTIDLPKIMAKTAGRSSWIFIIIASIVFGISAVMITRLNSIHQGEVFYDYSQRLIGKPLSYALAWYYMLMFLAIGIYLKLKLVILLKSNFLPQTPQVIMLIVGIALFGYVAYKGITNVARMFEIIGFLFIIVTIAICICLIIKGMVYNIMPLYTVSETENLVATFKDLITPFTGLCALFVIPFTKINKKASRLAFLTTIFIGLFYILIVESTIMILGINNTMMLNDSFIEAVKVVEFPIIERMDIFYLTFGLTSLFAGLIIVFTVILEFACKLFKNVRRGVMVAIIDIVFFLICLFALQLADVKTVYESFGPYMVLFSGIIIPTILLIISYVKRAKSRRLAMGGADEK